MLKFILVFRSYSRCQPFKSSEKMAVMSLGRRLAQAHSPTHYIAGMSLSETATQDHNS